MRCYKAEEKLK